MRSFHQRSFEGLPSPCARREKMVADVGGVFTPPSQQDTRGRSGSKQRECQTCVCQCRDPPCEIMADHHWHLMKVCHSNGPAPPQPHLPPASTPGVILSAWHSLNLYTSFTQLFLSSQGLCNQRTLPGANDLERQFFVIFCTRFQLNIYLSRSINKCFLICFSFSIPLFFCMFHRYFLLL